MNRAQLHILAEMARDPKVRDRIAFRLIVDTFVSVSPDFWSPKAEEWEEARPRPGDFRGKATAADLRAADARCAQTAEACRNAAVVARTYRPWWLDGLVDDVLLTEVAA